MIIIMRMGTITLLINALYKTLLYNKSITNLNLKIGEVLYVHYKRRRCKCSSEHAVI